MADEILTLTFERARYGSVWVGYFLDPIDPVIETAQSVIVPVTPSAAIPQRDISLLAFTGGELDAFNAGELMWTRVTIELTEEQDDSPALILEAIRELYDALEPGGLTRVEVQRRRWRFYGLRVDAL